MHKLLIANRGEIACRIIRTARAMGIRTVAVHSEADAGAMHVRAADEAVAIGPAPPRESYLVIDRILEAAAKTGADAVHPGYGFLSENAEFAERVREAGLIFVGPSADSIRVMGLKDAAKATMKAAGIPIVPGYQGEDQSLPRLERMAQTVGFPLLVKAVAGGGGKGMRPVHAAAELTEALLSAKREAAAAFGNDAVMLEKLIGQPRHVEVQIFGDSHGNIVHLFERDCSLQRRHQKLIEEAPAPGLSDRLRHMLGVAAVTAGVAIGYENAGTVEFILDTADLDDAGDPKFYFMEMNTRLQVEHPVTECITGLDLVEWQIRVARGEMLPLMQDAIEASGWAMEARLCAENPAAGFLPATGTLARLSFPGNARVDTGVRSGDCVTVHYDPMIAKVIAHGPTREAARRALVAALDATVADGVTTNRAFLARLAAHPAFAAGEITTGFIAAHEADLFAEPPVPDSLVAAAAATLVAGSPGGPSPFGQPFRLNLPATTHLAFWTEDGTVIPAQVSLVPSAQSVRIADRATHRVEPGDGSFAPAGEPAPVLILADNRVEIRSEGHSWQLFTTNPAWEGHSAAGPADGSVTAPMPGRLLSLHVKPGDKVAAGERLAVLEAMKMEHRLTAPFDAIVSDVHMEAGQQVAEEI
ncbi:MAG: biotin carboxylase N-terminal domain-containing protein, partial [Sphingomonadaceae bacterium]